MLRTADSVTSPRSGPGTPLAATMERTLSLSGSGRYIKVKFADEDVLGTSPVSEGHMKGSFPRFHVQLCCLSMVVSNKQPDRCTYGAQ